MVSDRPVTIRGYEGYIKEISIMNDGILSPITKENNSSFKMKYYPPVFNVILQDIKDPDITIHMKGILESEVNISI